MTPLRDQLDELGKAVDELNTGLRTEVLEPFVRVGLRVVYRTYARLAQIVAYFNVPK